MRREGGREGAREWERGEREGGREQEKGREKREGLWYEAFSGQSITLFNHYTQSHYTSQSLKYIEFHVKMRPLAYQQNK